MTQPPWHDKGFNLRDVRRGATRLGDVTRTWQVQRHLDQAYQPAPRPDAEKDDAWLDEVEESLPRTDPGPVDLGLLMRVMRRLEADGHRRGWDRNPVVPFIIYDHTYATTTDIIHQCVGTNPRIWPAARVGIYTGQHLFAPGLLDGVPDVMGPWEPFRVFALNLAYATRENCGGNLRTFQQVNVLRHTLRLPGIVGVGVMAEVWMRTLTPEQAEAESGRFVRYADQPDSVEGRRLWLVDMRNRVHTVGRMRGDKPFTAQTVTGPRTFIQPHADDAAQREDVDAQVFGEVTTSLKIIVDMIMGQTPDEKDHQLRYPTAQEQAAAARAKMELEGGQ